MTTDTPEFITVPREPTAEMCAAYYDLCRAKGTLAVAASEIYRAMMAAAPEAPPLPDDVAGLVEDLELARRFVRANHGEYSIYHTLTETIGVIEAQARDLQWYKEELRDVKGCKDDAERKVAEQAREIAQLRQDWDTARADYFAVMKDIGVESIADVPALVAEQACEIERLRLMVEGFERGGRVSFGDCSEEVQQRLTQLAAKDAEIERLREERDVARLESVTRLKLLRHAHSRRRPLLTIENKARVEAEAERDRLKAALKALTTAYVDFVNSGEPGCWDPEYSDEVIEARAALAEGGQT